MMEPDIAMISLQYLCFHLINEQHLHMQYLIENILQESLLKVLDAVFHINHKAYFRTAGRISRIFAQARKLSWCLASKITRYKLRCPLSRSTETDVSPESWYMPATEECGNLGFPATFTLPIRESRSPTAWPGVVENTGSNTSCRKLQFSRDLSA